MVMQRVAPAANASHELMGTSVVNRDAARASISEIAPQGVAVEGYGLSVTKWLPLEIPASASTLRDLTPKRNKLGHVLRTL